MEVDYYYLLGVADDSSLKEIRTAYRRMAEVYHPDKLRELPEVTRKEGEEIMRLLNEAKSVLMDPERKARYDERIGAGIELEDAVIAQGPGSDGGDVFMIAIEKETIAKKMARVLGSMKVAFMKDRDFQHKIAIAEEMVEAQVIEDDVPKTSSGSGPIIAEEEDEEVEMKLQFTVVDDSGQKEERKEGKGKVKKFKILAIEGNEDDGITDEDEVDMEWE